MVAMHWRTRTRSISHEECNGGTRWANPLLSLLDAGEDADSLLLRYLCARSGHPRKAAAMYASTAAWRDEVKIDELRAMSASEALGGDIELMSTFRLVCRCRS